MRIRYGATRVKAIKEKKEKFHKRKGFKRFKKVGGSISSGLSSATRVKIKKKEAPSWLKPKKIRSKDILQL